MDNIYKKLISNNGGDEGLLQLFCQSTDVNKVYSTGLGGTYELRIVNISVISNAVPGKEFSIEIISDTFRLDRGNGNENIKFIYRDYGASELTYPIKLRQAELRNFVSVSFLQLGTVGLDINASNYNIILTVEYKRL